MRHFWAALVLLCAGTADLRAQEARLTPGARVRVVQATTSLDDNRARRRGTQTGVLESMDSTTVTLVTGNRSVALPLNTVSRIDVSSGNASMGRGTLRGARRGALLGAGVGGFVVVMGAIGSGTGNPCRGNPTCTEEEPSESPAAVIAVILGGGTVLGGTVGALVGSVSRESWTPAWTRPEQVSLTVDGAASGGAQVGVAIRF